MLVSLQECFLATSDVYVSNVGEARVGAATRVYRNVSHRGHVLVVRTPCYSLFRVVGPIIASHSVFVQFVGRRTITSGTNGCVFGNVVLCRGILASASIV